MHALGAGCSTVPPSGVLGYREVWGRQSSPCLRLLGFGAFSLVLMLGGPRLNVPHASHLLRVVGMWLDGFWKLAQCLKEATLDGERTDA